MRGRLQRCVTRSRHFHFSFELADRPAADAGGWVLDELQRHKLAELQAAVTLPFNHPLHCTPSTMVRGSGEESVGRRECAAVYRKDSSSSTYLLHLLASLSS